jgi:HK97 family phage major capsid protein
MNRTNTLPEPYLALEKKLAAGERVTAADIDAANDTNADLNHRNRSLLKDAARVLREVAASYTLRAQEVQAEAAREGRGSKSAMFRSESDKLDRLAELHARATIGAECHEANLANAEFDAERFAGTGGGTTTTTSANRVERGLKALMVGSDTAGGFLDPPEFARQVVDLLRGATGFLESGPRQFTTQAEALELPAVLTDPTVYRPSEAGAVTASQPTYGKIRLSLMSSAIQIPWSVELGQDTQVASIVAGQAVRALAQDLDKLAFEGSGATVGLKGVSGISTAVVAADGALPSNLDPFAEAVGKLRAKAVGRIVFAMHPSLWGLLLKLKSATTGSNQPLFMSVGGVGDQVKPMLFGCPVYFSGQMSVTEVQGSSGAVCTSVLAYDPDQVAYCRHLASPTFIRDPFSQAGSGIEILHVRARQAVGVLNPSGVCWIKGFKLS